MRTTCPHGGIIFVCILLCRSRRLADGLVERVDERVDVDAVRHRALLDVLEVRRRAAEAAHARVHEDVHGVGVLLNDVDDAHILGDSHNINLLYGKHKAIVEGKSFKLSRL